MSYCNPSDIDREQFNKIKPLLESARKKHILARISHKILKKSDEMSCEMHRECARDHYQVDKARAIRDEDRTTDRSNFSRFCEKCGLERLTCMM